MDTWRERREFGILFTPMKRLLLRQGQNKAKASDRWVRGVYQKRNYSKFTCLSEQTGKGIACKRKRKSIRYYIFGVSREKSIRGIQIEYISERVTSFLDQYKSHTCFAAKLAQKHCQVIP
jgi:hypothetical protein